MGPLKSTTLSSFSKSSSIIVEWDSLLESKLPKIPCKGFIVKTNVTSWMGKILYSDFYSVRKSEDRETQIQDPFLNQIARLPVIGIIAGITRSTLAIIHILGHLFAALITRKTGHVYHAAKGACEFSRGLLEAVPIVGRIFSWSYTGVFSPVSTGSFWILKIHNSENPDLFDSQILQNSFRSKLNSNRTSNLFATKGSGIRVGSSD